MSLNVPCGTDNNCVLSAVYHPLSKERVYKLKIKLYKIEKKEKNDI